MFAQNCPKCGADELMIRHRHGLERMIIVITGKRKYLCIGCGCSFRAADYRGKPRPDHENFAPKSSAASFRQ